MCATNKETSVDKPPASLAEQCEQEDKDRSIPNTPQGDLPETPTIAENNTTDEITPAEAKVTDPRPVEPRVEDPELDEAIRASIETGPYNHAPRIALHAAAEGKKCSVCKVNKSPLQSWEIHNWSAEHIKNDIEQRKFKIVIRALDNNFRAHLKVKCDLCDTLYTNLVHFNAHKLEPEHQRRASELLHFANILRSKRGPSAWSSITKPAKITPANISRVLRQGKPTILKKKN